jgi:hypothetical protein
LKKTIYRRIESARIFRIKPHEHFFERIRWVGNMLIRLIFIFSNGLLFYLQNITEHNLRGSLFEEQKDRRFGSTKEISQPIGSDISLVMYMLDTLSNYGFFMTPILPLFGLPNRLFQLVFE